jgi:predicted MPP superfamily phosphohydrolase
VDWVERQKPDLTLISGDLLSRPSGEAKLRELVGRLPNAYAVLGNHDYAVTKDPFSRPVVLDELGSARLLADEAETVEVRGRQVQVVGVDPRSYRRGTARPERLADAAADLRISSATSAGDRLVEPGVFDLVLSGHLHAGQITLPYPGGRLRLAHLRWTYVEGVYERPGGVLHLSAGLGTTFVPFRFFARPAAYELVLHSAG